MNRTGATGTDAIIRTGMADRRRASRIRSHAQRAVDVPVELLRSLIDAAPPHARREVATVLGPRTLEALSELAAAS